MPNPLILWCAAMIVAAIGIRRGERSSSVRDRRTTGGAHALVSRLPVPERALAIAGSPGLERRLAVLDADGSTLRHVARLRACGAMVCAVVGALGAAFQPAIGLVGLAAAGCAYALPALRAGGRARRRREAIVAELPDLIDVVVLCADAGMPLEPSLRLVAARLPGPCAAEFAGALAAMDLGVSRRESYRRLADRVDAPEVRGLVAALIQADELGTPISDALTRQADIIRARRHQHVRDHAARAAPKVQLVVAMVMVPGALLVVVGVMVIQMLDNLAVVAGGLP